jgi:hypothetical protein
MTLHSVPKIIRVHHSLINLVKPGPKRDYLVSLKDDLAKLLLPFRRMVSRPQSCGKGLHADREHQLELAKILS